MMELETEIALAQLRSEVVALAERVKVLEEMVISDGK